MKPKMVILLIGTNDLSWYWEAEDLQVGFSGDARLRFPSVWNRSA